MADAPSIFPIKDTPQGFVKTAYGIDFPAAIPDYKIELHCCFRYKLTPEKGGLGPKEHLWNFIEIMYPEFYQKDNYFMDRFFAEALSEDYKFKFCIGPGGFGKTTAAALFAIAAWIENPKGVSVITCTTTIDSSEGRIWGKIKKLFSKKEEFSSFSKVTNRKIYYFEKKDTGTEKDTFHCMTVSALPRGNRGADSVLKGVHPDDTLILILDEMDESEPIDDVIENLQTGDVDFTLIGLGNPSDRFSALGLVCEPFGGWESIDPMAFKTLDQCAWDSVVDGARVLFFPGYLNPRITLSEKYPDKKEYYDKRFSYFSSRELLEEKRKTVPHAKYMEQFIGFFPKINTSGNMYVLDRADIKAHKAHEPAIFSGYSDPVLLASCDPAFTFGGDQILFRVAKYGIFANGKAGLCFGGEDHIHRIALPKSLEINKYQWITNEIVELLRHYKIKPEHFTIDANAAGDAIVEFLYRDWAEGFKCIQSKGSPTDRRLYVGQDGTAKDQCTNRITEYWLAFRKLVLAGQIAGLDNLTIQQLSSRALTQKENSQKLTLEPKEVYKKRMTSIGRAGASPDEGDTAVYIANLARDLGLLVDFSGAISPNEQKAKAYRAWYNQGNTEITEWDKQREENRVYETLDSIEDTYDSSDSDLQLIFTSDDEYSNY